MTQKVLCFLLLLLALHSAKAQYNTDYLFVDSCGPTLSKNQRTDFEDAYTAYCNKKYTDCLKLARKLSSQVPTSPHPYFLMGLVYAQREELSKVSAVFKKVISLCPNYNDARAHYYMGLINYSNNNFEEAIDNFKNFFDIADQEQSDLYTYLIKDAELYQRWSVFLFDIYENPVPFDPKPILRLSTQYSEILPFMSVDGNSFFFYRLVPKYLDNSKLYKPEIEEKVLKLFQSRKLPSGNYSEGKMMPSPFNRTGTEAGVTLTLNNQLLFYSLTTKNGEYNNSDIYYSQRKGGRWQPVENAGTAINTATSWETQPSISPDGSVLYFVSNRPGGFGGDDIWYSERQADGTWSEAKNMGPTINTAGNERFPFICADGETMFFSSNGWMGLGGYDIFYTRIGDKHFPQPENIGYPINTEYDELNFGVSVDGSIAYFESKKLKGYGGSDIFMFNLYPSARPQKMIVLKGSATNEKGDAVIGKISVNDHIGGKEHFYPINEHSGKFVILINASCENTISAWHNNEIFATKEIGKDTASCGNEIIFLYNGKK